MKRIALRICSKEVQLNSAKSQYNFFDKRVMTQILLKRSDSSNLPQNVQLINSGKHTLLNQLSIGSIELSMCGLEKKGQKRVRQGKAQAENFAENMLRRSTAMFSKQPGNSYTNEVQLLRKKSSDRNTPQTKWLPHLQSHLRLSQTYLTISLSLDLVSVRRKCVLCLSNVGQKFLICWSVYTHSYTVMPARSVSLQFLGRFLFCIKCSSMLPFLV